MQPIILHLYYKAYKYNKGNCKGKIYPIPFKPLKSLFAR